MKNINIVVFFTLLFSISILNLFSPKDKTISVIENRTLGQKPEISYTSIITGEFSKKFESYISDHFMYREKLVAGSNFIASLNGIKRNDSIQIVAFSGQNVGGNLENDNLELSQSGNVLILNDTIMEIYKFKKESSKKYAEMINKLNKSLPKDTKLYSLIVPIQIEFNVNEKIKNLSDSQREGINYINNLLDEDIIKVDVYDEIKKHIDEYVYFRADHHWTQLGAYYAYTKFCEKANIKPTPLDEYSKHEINNFLGYLSTINPTEKVNNNPDKIIYYKTNIESSMRIFYYEKDTDELKFFTSSVIDKSYENKDNTQKYGIFLGGDYPISSIKTNANSNRKIIIIKDSYANAFVPFLLDHYKEIYIIDPRHCRENIIDMINENNIDDVMFLNYILTPNFENYQESVLKLIQ